MPHTYTLDADMPQVLRDFLRYTETIKGKSSHTVDEYFLDLRTFLRFMKRFKKQVPADTQLEDIPIDDVTIDFIASITLSDLYEYMYFLSRERHNSAKTRSRKVSSLHTFYKYLCNKTNQLSYNPTLELELPKTPKTLPKYLSLEQSLDLLSAVDGENKERDFCIITLFLNCGLRLSELVGIDLDRVHLDDSTMTVLGKGNKERIVYLNEACKEAIRAYLPLRPVEGVKDKKALFLSARKQRISPKTVQWIIKERLKAAGLGGEGFSTHKLRHTAATLMYQHGNVDIRVLQSILGHENLGTTEIYTHLSTTQIEKAANANPLANVQPKKLHRAAKEAADSAVDSQDSPKQQE